jgi:signal transduction histidine kinase
MTGQVDSTARQAETQVIRSVTVVVGVSTLALFLLTLGSINEAAPHVDPMWTRVTVTTVFGIPGALALLAFRLRRRTLVVVLGSYALYFTAVVATFPLAVTSPLPEGLSPWPVLVTAIGTVPAALAWRPVAAWLWLLLNSALIAPVRYLAAGGGDWTEPMQYAFFTVTFAGIFSGLTIVALASGRALDAAAATARHAATTAAAAAAREQEQARLDALVHDDVISTLYYASQGNPDLEQSIRRQAARAIDHLATLRSAEPAAQLPVEVPGFIERLRSEAVSRSSDVAFTVIGERSTPVPAIVAEAIAEASAEALRNSVEHSGDRRVIRTVAVALTEQRIQVSIADNGPGFDPEVVPSHRLGIAVSIRGRLAAIEGGDARVTARAGEGTLVYLDWQQP